MNSDESGETLDEYIKYRWREHWTISLAYVVHQLLWGVPCGPTLEMVPGATFTCEQCHQTFPKGWTDEEKDAEAVVNGFDLNDDNVTVCDDCYVAIMKYNDPNWFLSKKSE